MRVRAAILAAALSLTTGLGWAAMTSAPSGIDERLHLEWEVVQSRGGRAVIDGYLYNNYKRPATNVVLLVETLDAASQVTGRTINQLAGTVPAFGRIYFQVPPKIAGPSYRITVSSFEWYAGSN